MQHVSAAVAARLSRRPGALAAFLLLFVLGLGGCAASAQAPLVVPESCDNKRALLVREAFTLAERRTTEAIAFLAAYPDHAHVRTWFGGGSAEKVRVRLTLTRDRLRNGQHPPWSCGTVESCGNRTTFAIADLRQGSVMLCPPFFNAANEGGDSRPGILVHEVSHLVAQTVDVAYGRDAARQLAERAPSRAILNADNLEYFVEFLPWPGAERVTR